MREEFKQLFTPKSDLGPNGVTSTLKVPCFNTVQIGPIEWSVERVPNLINDEGEPLYGQCENDKFAIKLSDDLRGAALTVTLWHEVLHGLDGIYGVGLSEAQVTLLAPMIVQLLQDNEELRG